MSQPPPPFPPLQPLEYSSQASPPRVWYPLSVAIHSFLIGGALTIFLIFIVPGFEQILKDFKTDLPFCTKVLLAMSRWAVMDYGWACLVVLTAIVPWIVGLIRGGQPMSVRAKRMTAIIARLLLAVLVIFIVLSLFMPMISLIEAVSSPKH